MATRLSDGSYQARYRPKEGPAKVWKAASPEAAEAKKDAYLRSIGVLAPLPTPSISRATRQTSVHEYAKSAWWPSVEATARESTVNRYRDDYRKFVRPEFGGLALGAVTYEHVQQWITRMKKEGAPSSSQRRLRGILSMILNLAVRNGVLEANPASYVKIKKPTRRKRVMSLSKAIEVMRAVEGTTLHAPIVLAMFLGLRRGEVAGLRWASVDVESRRIHVREQRVVLKKPYRLLQTELKREENERAFVVPEAIWSLLAAGADFDGEWVCRARNGRHRPWNPEKLGEKWNVVRKGLGLEDWHFHDLRHAAAGLLAGIGVDLLSIAAILGHVDIDSTQLYAAAQETSATNALKRLGTALLEERERQERKETVDARHTGGTGSGTEEAPFRI
jgi:integrase